jgi:hypothetical protein
VTEVTPPLENTRFSGFLPNTVLRPPPIIPGLDFFPPACYDKDGGISSAQLSQKIFSAGAIKRRADAFQL